MGSYYVLMLKLQLVLRLLAKVLKNTKHLSAPPAPLDRSHRLSRHKDDLHVPGASEPVSECIY